MFDIWHEDPRYPSDMTDDQWRLIQPLIPPGPPGGRDRRTSMRAAVNAISYINRGGPLVRRSLARVGFALVVPFSLPL
jgi:transposase